MSESQEDNNRDDNTENMNVDANIDKPKENSKSINIRVSSQVNIIYSWGYFFLLLIIFLFPWEIKRMAER